MSDEEKHQICDICRDYGEAHCDICELAEENEDELKNR